MIDAKAFGEELAAIVKAATAPLMAEIAALKAARDADRAEMADAIAKAISELPKPRDGVDGKDGAPGEKGADGAPGRDGVDGKDGRDGAPGEKGADGVGLADALIDRDGALVVTMTNGTAKALGGVVGKDGSDGQDGAAGRDGVDGLGFDDMDFAEDDHGRLVVRFQRGDVIKSAPIPSIIDRGQYRTGDAYQKGDAVSYGGSLWIAQGDTSERPEGGAGWRLAVKRGRDGRDTEAKKVL